MKKPLVKIILRRFRRRLGPDRLARQVFSGAGLFRLFSFFLFFVLILFPFTGPVGAATEEECRKKEEDKQWDEAQRCWDDYFGERKRTLKNEIESKNVQIELTTRKIIAAQADIAALMEEILRLDSKIVQLDGSLDELSEIFVKRIAETYKKGKLDPLALFFSADDFSQFVSRYQYLRVIQVHDRKLMVQMETARTNYEGQKNLKEEKQAQLQKLQRQLEAEKYNLAQAAKAKQVLLTQTEASYQKTMARIEAEKAKLAGVSVFGRPVEFKEWSGDNHYFNQTDSRWAMMLIGGGVYDAGDPSYMWKYGCAVTSMSMVLKKWGVDIDPGRLSQMPLYRTDLIAWQDIPGAMGGSIQVIGHGYGGTVSWEAIDQTLAGGNWVIVYISGVGHYVVLTNKDGDDYKMHDPYFGPGMNFSSKYSRGAVDEMVIYTR